MTPWQGCQGYRPLNTSFLHLMHRLYIFTAGECKVSRVAMIKNNFYAFIYILYSYPSWCFLSLPKGATGDWQKSSMQFQSCRFMTPGLNLSLSACVSQLRIRTMMLDTVLAERKDFKTSWPIKTTKCNKSELHASLFWDQNFIISFRSWIPLCGC